jgi:hypothetical protein
MQMRIETWAHRRREAEWQILRVGATKYVTTRCHPSWLVNLEKDTKFPSLPVPKAIANGFVA